MSQTGPGELYELRQQVISLEEKNERLASSLVSARDRIRDLGEQLDSLSRPPASSSNTRFAGSADSRFATMQPAVPAPTTM